MADNAVDGNGDRTFTAQYTPIDYEIEYIMNGGTNHVDNPDT